MDLARGVLGPKRQRQLVKHTRAPAAMAPARPGHRLTHASTSQSQQRSVGEQLRSCWGPGPSSQAQNLSCVNGSSSASTTEPRLRHREVSGPNLIHFSFTSTFKTTDHTLQKRGVESDAPIHAPSVAAPASSHSVPLQPHTRHLPALANTNLREDRSPDPRDGLS